MIDKINDRNPGYRSPESRIVFVKMQGVLCESLRGLKNTTEMEEGSDNG